MIEPLISMTVEQRNGGFHPGDELECEYQIDAVAASEIQAVEASVLWYTEGKGDEDMAVHYFERLVPQDCEDGDLRPLRKLRTRLPNSPLSYSGEIVKVRWCARVRVFLRGGKEVFFDRPFQLCNAHARQSVAAAAAFDVAGN